MICSYRHNAKNVAFALELRHRSQRYAHRIFTVTEGVWVELVFMINQVKITWYRGKCCLAKTLGQETRNFNTKDESCS